MYIFHCFNSNSHSIKSNKINFYKIFFNSNSIVSAFFIFIANVLGFKLVNATCFLIANHLIICLEIDIGLAITRMKIRKNERILARCIINYKIVNWKYRIHALHFYRKGQGKYNVLNRRGTDHNFFFFSLYSTNCLPRQKRDGRSIFSLCINIAETRRERRKNGWLDWMWCGLSKFRI